MVCQLLKMRTDSPEGREYKREDKRMNFKERLKDLKVAKKLNVYRMCMIIIMIVMGIVSIMLSFLMNTSVKEITNVW